MFSGGRNRLAQGEVMFWKIPSFRLAVLRWHQRARLTAAGLSWACLSLCGLYLASHRWVWFRTARQLCRGGSGELWSAPGVLPCRGDLGSPLPKSVGQGVGHSPAAVAPAARARGRSARQFCEMVCESPRSLCMQRPRQRNLLQLFCILNVIFLEVGECLLHCPVTFPALPLYSPQPA